MTANSAFAFALASVILNASAQIALRKAMLALGSLPAEAREVAMFASSALTNLWFLTGMGCYALSIGMWLIVLSKLEVSAAYPLLSIGFVMTAFVGFFFLNESVGPLRVGGIVLICLGIYFITRSV